MNEYSFIVEFDEMSESQINKLWEYLSEKNIKFHVLKDEDLKNENQELKKRLEEHIKAELKMEDEFQKLEEQDYTSVYLKGCADTKGKYLSQQKEFIKWLESESKELIRDAGYYHKICLEILDKYKEIIGGDNK